MRVQIAGDDQRLRRERGEVRSLASGRGASIQYPIARLSAEQVGNQLRSLVLKINQTIAGEFAKGAARALEAPGVRRDLRGRHFRTFAFQLCDDLPSVFAPLREPKRNRRRFVI